MPRRERSTSEPATDVVGEVRSHPVERSEHTPLRPLIVINSLGLGGAEQSTAQLVEGLARRGMDPHVVCLKDFSTAATDRVRAVGVDVRQLGCTRPMAAARRIRSIIEEVDADLVHLVLFDSLLAGTVATRGSKVPVVASVVSTPRSPTGAAVAARLAGTVETVALRRADAVHAVTPGVADAVRRVHGIDPDRIHVAERGRDPETFARADPAARVRARRELEIEPDAEVVLCVGRHEADKGIDLLIESLGGLDRPGLVVLLAGREGLETTRLRAGAERSDNPERFRFLGHRDDVPTLLRAADVLAVPSLREGAAGSVIEAMAVGVPIAAFELEGLAGILGHDRTALLATDRRAGSLAAAVLALLDDPERATRIADAAHAQFLERFTLDAAVEAMAALYRSVAGTRR